MIGQIYKKDEYTIYGVQHIASEGDIFDLDTELKYVDSLTKMTDGHITENGCITDVKIPTKIEGESKMDENLRHAAALEKIAKDLLEKAKRLRKKETNNGRY